MNYIGIDLSMTSPSVCVLSDDGSFANSKFYFLTKVKKLVGNFYNITGQLFYDWSEDMERYHNIAQWVMDVGQITKDDKVFIEGYSMNSKGKIFQIHENTAILKFLLYQNQIKPDTIPPTVIKKKYTGKGNAPKEIMYETFLKNNPDIRDWVGIKKTTKIGNPISDLIDSYAIALCGRNLI